MSKKISIDIPNKVKPNLVKLFHQYICRKSKEYDIDYDDMDIINYYNVMFPGWDDECELMFPSSDVGKKNKHKSKHNRKNDDVYVDFWQQEREEDWERRKHKKGSKSRARLIDINVPYNGEEEDGYNFDDIALFQDESKEIWFYPDYHSKDDRLEFNSIKDFSDYCCSMGYWVDKCVMGDISWRYESHCCLNPESERLGLLEIMSSHSYGEMFYDACDESELSD